ncbi:AAA domain-containing protein [Arthrobacter sp. AG258]|uniref:serine/threonine-protein kinase n=1 Tax=Arthrobacter sp. AG258 TaxID=2183899 RepID=UPI0010E5FE2D|nr:serine/threonine-protein kinase [Arthrobacter sp. AG258]TDT78667.1 AAA domain-containing protein [Arthrobacter sp. AG258]
MADEVGGHFTLLEVGSRRGNFGVVRKGIDRRDGSFVAVKFVNSQSDDLSLKVFRRETRTLGELTHPNIVRYRGSGIDETGTYYIVLDWVERNLDDVLKETGPWTSWDRLYTEFALPLVEALAYTHLKQVEHRDIKPKNVLMSSSGVPMLADFGIAKIRGDEEETTNTVADWHSRPYAPPELNADARYVRDVYSIGVLLLQCLSKNQLTSLADVEHAVQGVDVPPAIRKILDACIATDPSERPKNASDLLGLLATAQKRRVTTAASSKAIWLRMQGSAAAALAGDRDNRQEAQAIAQADLAGEVYSAFFFDRDTGEPQRDSLFIVGETWRFHIKPDGEGAVLVSAKKLEFDELERFRRRALLLSRRYQWAFYRPTNLTAAREAVGELIDALDDFYNEQAESIAAGAVDREGDDLFDTWLRVLTAREELARGEKKPIAYTKCTTKGREATFTLVDPVEQDLVNTEWRVKDQYSERRFGWGEVVDHDGDKVVILGNRWGSLPDRGHLIPHIGPDEIAIGRQREAVIAVKNGAAARPELRELLLRPEGAKEPCPAAITNWSRNLDSSKKEAVSKAIGASDLFLVQGPPGTGKTSFIAELVEQTLLAKPDARILIASQTNVAVDNALEKLDAGGFSNLVRLTSADVTRVSNSVRHLLLEAQMKRWAQLVRKRAEAQLGARAEAAGIPSAHLRAALALQQFVGTVNEITMLQSRALIEDQKETEETELTTALGPSESTSSVQERVDALIDLRDELVEEAQSLLASDLTLSRNMTSQDALNAVELLVGDGDAERALLARLRLQGQWLQRIASDERLATTFLDQTSVIAGTCTGFLRHPAVRHLDIDLCIVDEASRATLTEALVPVSRANRWVFVGDTKQLPPTDEELLRSRELLTEQQLSEEDIKETLFQRLADKLPPHSQMMLSQQYRMIRPIGDLISSCFYDEKLSSNRENGLDGYEVGYGKPVMWVDTSALGDIRRESAPQGQATSYANRAEVRVLMDRLRILNNAIDHKVIKLPKESKALEVLVIAPYVSQVTELKVQVAPLLSRLPHLNVTIMSVDAVQGRESDVALLSVTRSNAGGHLGFLGPEYWRRINVALSRAKFGLTIVGDAGFIKGTTGALRQVLTYIEMHHEDCEIRMAER